MRTGCEMLYASRHMQFIQSLHATTELTFSTNYSAIPKLLSSSNGNCHLLLQHYYTTSTEYATAHSAQE